MMMSLTHARTECKYKSKSLLLAIAYNFFSSIILLYKSRVQCTIWIQIVSICIYVTERISLLRGYLYSS